MQAPKDRIRPVTRPGYAAAVTDRHRGHYLDATPPLAFAHRGGAGDWPENTWPAFEAAVALGYQYLETDVHATADGVVVAFHDRRLDRVTDRIGEIADLPYAEVARARVDGKEPIIVLAELLSAFPDARFNIDAKDDRVVGPLSRVLTRAAATGRVCIGSFSDRRLTMVRRHLGPDVCLSAGPVAVARHRLGLPARSRYDHACLQVPPSFRGVPVVTGDFVRRAHRHGLQVHVWTIDDPTEMARLLDLGVDGIMTDRPSVLRDVLSARGAW